MLPIFIKKNRPLQKKILSKSQVLLRLKKLQNMTIRGRESLHMIMKIYLIYFFGYPFLLILI